jgi:membrane-bound lytic murein transglycosylase D
LAAGLSGCVSSPIKTPKPGAPGSGAEAADEPSPADFSLPPLALIDFDPESKGAETELSKAPPEDLWERIRRGFALPVPDNARIRRELKWYLRHPQHLQEIETRARPYLYFIVEEIERRDMPGEIALLPAVESAFQPFAHSPGRASGIWQFIPSTGRMFELKQTWWFDGRRDIVASTRAALDYLQQLNRRFGGNWELALAAYNSGGATVSRALRRNRSKGLPADYWSLDLPRETEAYVPRLLALARLVAAPESFGIALQEMPNRPYFTRVDIGAQLDLSLASELAGVSVEELYRLNPGLKRWVTDPDGPHRLYLPIEQATRFQRELATVAPDERLRWRRYQIRRGDTLGQIAQNQGISLEMLKQANQLRSSRIVAGNHLLIPSPPQPSGRLGTLAAGSGGKRNATRYRVQGGDSLWRIARRHRLNHKQLARWNRIDEDELLRPGQVLTLGPPSGKGATPDPSADLSSVQYRVRRGDSLSTIAHRFKVSVADLRRWNRLPDNLLMPGQRLVLYLDPSNQQAL